MVATDGPNPLLVQTGDLIDGPGPERHSLGFYGHDKSVPEVCPCCNLKTYWEHGFSVALGRDGWVGHECAYAASWMQDHKRRVACDRHFSEKTKDGLFGAGPGDFALPDGTKPFYKRPDSRATAPVVHG